MRKDTCRVVSIGCLGLGQGRAAGGVRVGVGGDKGCCWRGERGEERDARGCVTQGPHAVRSRTITMSSCTVAEMEEASSLDWRRWGGYSHICTCFLLVLYWYVEQNIEYSHLKCKLKMIMVKYYIMVPIRPSHS